MKKGLSIILSLAMMFTLSIPVLAAEENQIQELQTPETTIDLGDTTNTESNIQEEDSLTQKTEPVEIKLSKTEVTRRGRVNVYSFSVTDSGYIEIPKFRGEYAKNSRITFNGTWSPSYENVSIMVKDVKTGGSSTVSASCNKSRSITLWSSSTWTMYIKSNGSRVSGTIRVEVS